MLKLIQFLALIATALLAGSCGSDGMSDGGPVTDPLLVTQFLTTPGGAERFVEVSGQIRSANSQHPLTIDIQRSAPRQEMAGFGFAVTGGSASHINAMSQAARTTLLNELFGTAGSSIGLSFIRISVGASDLDASAFSYNDDPNDPEHNGFSLGPHLDDLIPVLKEILAINPDIAIMASPWSAPSWMKTNNSFIGGSLRDSHRDTYAAYLVKYIEEMAQEGITIDYLTVQNEPLHGGNNPSMEMSAEQQATFIKDHLGPAFAAAGNEVKIIAYDHNADNTAYPLTVLGDAAAAAYVDGSAYHLYAGNIDALSGVHDAHPDKHIYFTEQWYNAGGDFASDFRWHMRNVLIGGTRNWCRGIIEWNLSSNSSLDPRTPEGCGSCLGAITIDGDQVSRNAGYYVIAHASKFVRPGSIYLPTSDTSPLHSAAFLTPDNRLVLIVLNDGSNAQTFNVQEGENSFSTTLSAGAAATFIWDSE